MTVESQSRNPALYSAPPAQDSVTTSDPQPRKPNILQPLVTKQPQAQPSTKNPTLTTEKSPARYKTFDLVAAYTFITLVCAFLLWLAYLIWPRMDTFFVHTVSSATVDPFNISSSRLTAAWNISLHIKSYNQRKELSYDRVRASIYYGSHILSEVSIHPFYLSRVGTVTLHPQFMAHSESVDVGAADSMVRDRLLRGAVDFRFELLARATYSSLFSTWMFNVTCENVTIGFPALDGVGPGVMLGPPRKCHLYAD